MLETHRREQLEKEFWTAWNQFDSVRYRFDEIGGADEKPREVLKRLLMQSLNGRPAEYPRSRSGWGLREVRSAGVAVQYLTAAARRVIQAAKQSPETGWKALRLNDPVMPDRMRPRGSDMRPLLGSGAGSRSVGR